VFRGEAQTGEFIPHPCQPVTGYLSPIDEREVDVHSAARLTKRNAGDIY